MSEIDVLHQRLRQLAGPDVHFAPAEWRRHVNPDQSPGAWVHQSASVGPGVHADAEAIICGEETYLSEDARVEGPSFVGPGVIARQGTVIASSHVSVLPAKHLYGAVGTTESLGLERAKLREADVTARGHIWQSTLGEGVRVRGLMRISKSALDHAAEVIGDTDSEYLTEVHQSVVTDGARIAGRARFLNSRADSGAVVDLPRVIRGERVSDNRHAAPPSQPKVPWNEAPFPDRRGSATPLSPQPEKIK
ncbi:MAG: hypothetical protein PW734_04670 [Verrucomicrobium sp.]|nr:hypothetical protein [Verrucomicrobium sp.]